MKVHLKNKASEETSIYFLISFNSKRLKYSPSISIKTKCFNQKTQRLRYNAECANSQKINNEINRIEQIIDNILFEQRNNKALTTNELKRLIDKELKNENDTSFFAYLKQYYEDIKAEKKIGKENQIITVRTHYHFKQLYDLLNEFDKDFDFNKINYQFYQDFVFFLVNEKKFKQNNIAKHIKTFKTLVYAAIREKVINAIDLTDFKVIKEETEFVYLTSEELALLRNLEGLTKKLDNVRDLFLLQCYTGLRVSDLMKLKEENFKNDLIYVNTKKTGADVVIPANSVIKEILAKRNNKLPGKISEQKYNDYLKELTKDVLKEKSEKITSHTARRTFVTNLVKQNLSDSQIMKLTGHKTTAMIVKYNKMTAKENAENVKSFLEF